MDVLPVVLGERDTLWTRISKLVQPWILKYFRTCKGVERLAVKSNFKLKIQAAAIIRNKKWNHLQAAQTSCIRLWAIEIGCIRLQATAITYSKQLQA